MNGLKQRIIGALVLISLAVIFVPMMFDEPHNERSLRSLDIPEEPPFPEVSAPASDNRINGVPEYRVQDLEPTEAITTAEPQPSVESPRSQDGDSDAVSQVSQSGPRDNVTPQPEVVSSPSAGNTREPSQKVVEPEPQPEPAKESADTVSDSSASRSADFERTLKGAWVLQLGSFGNEDNARRLRDSVRERGYGAHLQELDRGEQHLVRVFSGPFVRKEDAEQAKAVLDKAFNIKSLVTQGGG